METSNNTVLLRGRSSRGKPKPALRNRKVGTSTLLNHCVYTRNRAFVFSRIDKSMRVFRARNSYLRYACSITRRFSTKAVPIWFTSGLMHFAADGAKEKKNSYGTKEQRVRRGTNEQAHTQSRPERSHLMHASTHTSRTMRGTNETNVKVVKKKLRSKSDVTRSLTGEADQTRGQKQQGRNIVLANTHDGKQMLPPN